MTPQGRLLVASGHACEKGVRPENQDFAGVYAASELERMRHGMIAALADGVSGAKGGRVAAELAVRALIDGFYTVPDTIGVAAAAHRVMAPYNRWLTAMGRTETMAHAATTFTALVIRGRKAHVLHVGDSRAWLFRDGHLAQITEDHTLSHPDQRHILYRGIGIEENLRLDHHEIALAEHDRLLLTSDGVHGTLSRKKLERLLEGRNSAEAEASAIVTAALDAGSQDNASAIVLDVVALPMVGVDSLAGDIGRLPILPPPAPGDSIDGFRLDHLISDGRYTRLFRATDTATGHNVVVKFPKPELLSEQGAKLSFMREILVASRVASPFVGSAIPVDHDRQTRLYGVQPYYEGMTLEQRLRTPIALAEGLRIAAMLARAVAALHRLEIIHRDIKPENVILTGDDGLRLIDLGVARLPRVEEFAEQEIPGTPSFLAPEMFTGSPGDEATDIFALGVTLWRLFCQTYPYGEIEAFSRPRFRPAAAPSQTRADLPAWLDQTLLRAVAIDPRERFGDVIELLRALENGPAMVRADGHKPLIQRHPVGFWQAVSALLAVLLAASLLLR